MPLQVHAIQSFARADTPQVYLVGRSHMGPVDGVTPVNQAGYDPQLSNGWSGSSARRSGGMEAEVWLRSITVGLT